MGGIAGIWRNDRSAVQRDALSSMLAAIRHRGPDDVGTWCQGHAALGSNRLCVRDPTAAGHQPMVSEDGQAVLVYDGEIYNHRELRGELEDAGIVFKGTSDTEVVLKALNHWGPAEAIPRFNGMFAFGYVDKREQALWLARDRVGIKPIVTASVGSMLIFASEAKALIVHPQMRRRVDKSALMKMLVEEKYSGQVSILDGIEAVEPGSYWKVSARGIEREQYFDVLQAIDIDRLIDADRDAPATFVSAFQDKLMDSVNRQLIGDVPIASTCSGGIDSSLMSAYARRSLPNLVAYVGDVPVGRGEGALGEGVGRHIGVEVRRVPVDKSRYLRLWPRAVWYSDRPATYPNAPVSLAISEACQADGFKVLLMGLGADILFGEKRGFQKSFRNWQRLAFLARFWPSRENRRKLEMLERMPLSGMGGEGNPALHLQLAMTHDGEHAFLAKRLFGRLSKVKNVADRAFLADCLLQFCNRTPWLVQRHERMGMAASIEMRMPFLDNDMLDFAINLPRRAKRHRRHGKWVVKQAAHPVLPRDAVFTRKTGFAVPSNYHAGTEGLLVGGMLAEQFGWTPATTSAIVSELAQETNLKFFVVGLELWLRLYIGNENAEELGERLIAHAASPS